jgi:drug/metabolite transporter (DMT)-like permease
MTGLLVITLAALLNSAALICLRVAGREIQWVSPVLTVGLHGLLMLGCGLLAYLTAFFLTIRILANHDFGYAVPMFVGIQFIFSLLAARWVFNETINWVQVAGALLIALGVSLLVWKE